MAVEVKKKMDKNIILACIVVAICLFITTSPISLSFQETNKTFDSFNNGEQLFRKCSLKEKVIPDRPSIVFMHLAIVPYYSGINGANLPKSDGTYRLIKLNNLNWTCALCRIICCNLNNLGVNTYNCSTDGNIDTYVGSCEKITHIGAIHYNFIGIAFGLTICI